MRYDTAIRVLLALYLALWTPAWCCCAIRSGIGLITGNQTAGILERECCSSNSMEFDLTVPESTCCSSANLGEPCTEPISDSPCRCHEIGNDRTRIDTSAKVTLPLLSLALIVPVSQVTWLDLPCEHIVLPAPLQLDRPPPNTLLAQHCLLVI